jgi:hypothetical protein
MQSLDRAWALTITVLGCILAGIIGCQTAKFHCTDGEVILFSTVGKSFFRDSVCGVCPDGTQYRVLLRPETNRSFISVQGYSLDSPVVVTVHELAQNNKTEDHLAFFDVNSSELHPVPKLPGEQGAAAISPDGSRIAYELKADAAIPLRMAVTDINRGKTDLVASQTGELDRLPTWSPDSNEIMFIKLQKGDGHYPILASLMRTSNPFNIPVTIFGSDDLIGSCAYSPNGRQFAIWSRNGLELVERSNLSRRTILPTASLDGRRPGTAGLIWSRKSDTIAFTLFNTQTSASELWTIRSDGSALRLIRSTTDTTIYVGSFAAERK